MSVRKFLQTISPYQQLWLILMVVIISPMIAACGGGASPASTSEPKAVARTVEVEKEVEEATKPESANIRQTQGLRAGEVDDNARWGEYLRYLDNYYGPGVHKRDISERYIIAVKDGQGVPVLDAQVSFLMNDGGQNSKVYEARTYANGQVLFHPRSLGLNLAQDEQFIVQVEKGNQRSQFTLPHFEPANSAFAQPLTINLNEQVKPDNLKLDVLFLIDATGSMSDEINKIQSSIFDVAARIDVSPGQPDVRYGMVTYRDRGDSFVSQTYEFTPDVAEFHRHLKTVRADGGGDYPESLNEGLYKAVHNVEWRGEDTIRLIFLVADAPPHLDYANDYDYAIEMEEAARRGIKILPIASSGLDDQGEYIFRQLAQFTQGRFIFLTYQGNTNGGAPGNDTTHHVDNYTVENLDDLLVGLVEEELAHQTPQVRQSQNHTPDLDDAVSPVIENVSRSGDNTVIISPPVNTQSSLPSHSIAIAGLLVGGMLGGIFWVVTSVNAK